MDFIGQRAIVEDFQEKIKHNTIGHAYAITGPVGMGKKTLTHYLAKMLLCEGGEEKPCNQCRACKSYDEEGTPRLTIVRSETQRILIKQVRGLIEDIGIRPASGRKVYIIEDADRMTTESQNCLLKTLEEPPPYAVILLTTSFYESLLLTIRSRVVQVKMKPYTHDEMKRILEQHENNILGKEHVLAWSQGIPGRALKLIDDDQFALNRQMVFQFLFQETEFAHLEINQYLARNKEAFLPCLDIMESVYRDALMVLCQHVDGLINSDKKDNIVAYAQRTDLSALAQKIDYIQEMRSNHKRNMNYQLAVDMMTLGV